MADQPAGGGDNTIPLDLTAALAAADVAEVLGVTISHVPEGAALSAGTDAGGGTWTLAAAALDGLSITPAPGRHEAIRLQVVVAAREGDGDAARPTTVAFGLTVPGTEAAAVPEPESAGPAPVTGDDESTIPLDIDTGMLAAGGAETVGVSLSGVPEGAALSAGIDNGDGTWTLEPADLDGLLIRLPAGAEAFFILGIAAFAADGSIATASIRVDAEEPPEPEPGPPEPEPERDIAPGPQPEIAPLELEPEAAAPESDPSPEPAPDPEPAPESPGAGPGTRPLAYWKLDEPAPGAVGDEMGAHPGRVEPAAGDDAGAFDAVAAFNGTSDVIAVADAAPLNPAGGTLTVWFNAYASAYGVIAAKGAEGEGHLRLGVKNGGLEFVVSSAAGTHRAQGGAFGANEWNQATVTWGAHGMKVYLNGELVAADDHPGGLDAAGHSWLFGAAAAQAGGYGDFFHGELDDIALYGHPMTAAEVQDLCHLGVDGLIAGKTAADIDSGLDLDAIPAELEGPESLATVDENLDGHSEGHPDGPGATAAAPEPSHLDAGDDDPVVPEFDAGIGAGAGDSLDDDDPPAPGIDIELEPETDAVTGTEIAAGDDDPVVPEFDAKIDATYDAEDSLGDDDPVVPEIDTALDAADDAAAEPAAPAGEDDEDGEGGEVFPDEDGWSETVGLDDSDGGASGDDAAAVTLAGDGEPTLEGGEKLEW